MKIFVVILLSLTISSCKEDIVSDDFDKNQPFVLLLDSIYYYASEIYYWNDYIPDYNNILQKRNLELSENESINNELINITSNAINLSTGMPYDFLENNKLKYTSFFSDRYSDNNEDFGYGIVFSSFKEDDIRVQYVMSTSTAYNKGIRRGMKLLSINNTISKTNASFYSYLKNELCNSEINMILKKNNDILNIHLNKEKILFNPILKDTILNVLDTKIGYLSYLSFQNSSFYINQLADIFFKFERAHIEKLIIDLRYNQGGYISTVDYFANILIPINCDGEIMRYEEYNACMQKGQAKFLENQRISYSNPTLTLYDYDYSISNNTYCFNKTNTANDIKQIIFIISNATASASELLINVLKPFMPISIIGVNNGGNNIVYSYGKPVGSIGINILNYIFYLPMFKNYNSIGDGDYFGGMKADVSILDDLDHDFGDSNELSIIKSLELFGIIQANGTRSFNNDNYKISSINNHNLPVILIKD